MAVIINTKLGEHRGKKRLWLEGGKLLREGYAPGMRYDVEVSDSQVRLRINENGKFNISRRQRNGVIMPIIDLRSDAMAAVFDGIKMLRVAINKGVIVVSAHHQQLRIKERVSRLMDKLKQDAQIAVCSLFHGGGVLDKSMHAGLSHGNVRSKVAIAVELESNYLDSSLRNNPELWDDNSVIIESPIQFVGISYDTPQVDLLLAGIPCTGASKSGRTRNKLKFAEDHESAGSMFFSYLHFIQLLNPAIVILENVVEYASTASMSVIRSVLSSLGYNIQERTLCGNEFGVLEKRKRLCMVAVSEGIEGFDLNAVMPFREKEACINDILEPVSLDSARWKEFDYLAEKELRDKNAGKGFSRQLLTGEEGYCGVIGKDYAKCRSTEPFIIHTLKNFLSRIMMPIEHARVKGIPFEVVNGLSDTVAHQILGQSVIYPAFEAVGRELAHSLRSWAKPISKFGNNLDIGSRAGIGVIPNENSILSA